MNAPATSVAALSLLGALLAGACTADQAHRTAQAWQRNQCARLPEQAEYDRCVARAVEGR